MTFSDFVPELAGGIPLLLMFALFALGTLLERASPIEHDQPHRNTVLNIAYATITGWLGVALGPLLGIAATAIINALGGGFIVLPSRGAWLIVSAIVYLLAIDLMEYAFHRAQHAWPFLWAMHSFHHSDPSVNVTTTARHYWLEMPLKAIFVYPLLAVLFKVPAAVLGIYAVSTLMHYVNHLNVRWRSPIPWMVLNNPQFHRIHHSLSAEHRNKNFAPYFPIWDILFGTAHAPALGEYPQATGIEDAPRTIDLKSALLWPWRAKENPSPVKAEAPVKLAA